jgi:deoxycytidine triphosphate deaminase
MKHIMGPKSKSTLTKVQKEDVQPNAVDLRLGKVFKMSGSTFKIDEKEKVHRGSYEMQPDGNGYYNLAEGHYEVVMENEIVVGENEAGWVITRSTLNRNGVFLTSGLYDSGYDGVMAGVMHVTCGPMRIQRGTRIGQYLSFDSESLHKYDGDYGKAKAHDQKYQPTQVDEAAVLSTALLLAGNAEASEQVLNEALNPPKRKPGRPFGTKKVNKDKEEQDGV